MMKTNLKERKSMERVVSRNTFDYEGKLIYLEYDGNVVFDTENGINRITRELKEMKEASFRMHINEGEFKNDKKYYLDLAKEIGLEKAIIAMQEEIHYEKLGKFSMESLYLKSLKKLQRKCK